METVPLPSSHLHDVGPPVERSLKLTTRGAQPETGDAEKFALSWADAFSCIHKSSILNRMDIGLRSWFISQDWIELLIQVL